MGRHGPVAAPLSLIEAMGAQFVPRLRRSLAATHLLQLLGRPDQQATWLPAVRRRRRPGRPRRARSPYELDCVSTRADKVEQDFG